MIFAIETLRRIVLQKLSSSKDPSLDIDPSRVEEASFEELKQYLEEIKHFQDEIGRQKRLIDSETLMSFEDAVTLSGQKNAYLSKWAQPRFKEFFVKRSEENSSAKDIYAQTISGHLYIWDSVNEKWKKAK